MAVVAVSQPHLILNILLYIGAANPSGRAASNASKPQI